MIYYKREVVYDVGPNINKVFPFCFFFFLNDPAPPEISPLPLPAPLPISLGCPRERARLERRRQRRPDTAGCAQPVVGAHLDTVEGHLEELLAAQRVERHARDPRAIGRKNEQAELSTLAHRHDQLVGDVSILDEELATGQPTGDPAIERDRAGIERTGLLHERQGRETLAGGQRREPTPPP